MAITNQEKLAEIDSNLERFLELLPTLLNEHQSEYVLMRHKSIEGYYKSAIDAQIAGNKTFADRVFSIQHVKEMSEELGYFSHALHSGET